MKRLTNEEFIKRISEKGFYTKEKYKNNQTLMTIFHECGESFSIMAKDLFKLKDCPKCGKFHKYDKISIEREFPDYEVIEKLENNYYLFKHISCGTTFKTTLKLFLKARVKCPNCSNRNSKRSDEQFKKEIFNLVGDEYLFLEPYKNNMEKLEVIHNICGHKYKVTPNKFINLGRRCPNCYGNIKKTLDEVKREIEEKDNDYEVVDIIYTNSSTPLKIKHKKCGQTFKMRRTDFIKENGNRCPFCNESKGEKLISELLKNNGFKFETQYRIKEFSNIKRFDFAIFNEEGLKCLLEYDGIFHFKPFNSDNYSINKFKLQVKSDREKEKFCIENNIKLIRIPYWYFESLDKIVITSINNNDFVVLTTDIPINSKINYFSSTTIENTSEDGSE